MVSSGNHYSVSREFCYLMCFCLFVCLFCWLVSWLERGFFILIFCSAVTGHSIVYVVTWNYMNHKFNCLTYIYFSYAICS